MMAILRHRGRLLVVAALLAIVGSGTVARGQDDEEPDDDAVPANQMAGVMIQQMPNIEQVDQWVFGRFGGSGGARTRLDSTLALRLEDLGRTCGITEAQKKKLKLAGRGDVKRFFDRVEELKRRFQALSDPNVNIWQEIQPLQIEINAGLFGDSSLYAKTIRSTLTADQTTRYESVLKQRRLARYRSTVAWFVVHVDKGLGLRDDQRQRFVELLINETRPPRKFGQGDYWYLMLQTARVPEAKLKTVFDAPQWRLLSRQFAQARGMEQWLKTNGVVPDDGTAPPPAATAGVAEFFDMPVAPPAARVVRFGARPPAPPPVGGVRKAVVQEMKIDR
jgi:hypothetical protein